MNLFSPSRGALAARLFCALSAALLLTDCGDSRKAPAPPTLPAAPEDGASFSGPNAYAHAKALCELGPRPGGSPAYAAQLDYLEKQLRAVGWEVQRDTFTPLPGHPMCNLRATFGGGDGGRPILLSCHIDTKAMDGFIGADDGASAAGVLTELARVLAKTRPEQARITELIFLDGEEAFGDRMNDEDGLYGSKYDVARRGQGNLPRYHVNLDMVGGADSIIAIPAYDTSEAMMRHYADAVLTTGLNPSRWTAINKGYLDDHRPYLEAGADSLNIIAYFLGSDWWHTTRDNLSRLSPRPMGEAGRLTLELIRRFCEEPARP